MKKIFNKEKIKQIFLTIIAFSLILLGYFNYNIDKKSQDVQLSMDEQITKIARNEQSLGDVQLVNSEPELDGEGAIVPNNELELNNLDESTNQQDEYNYFEESKIQRDKMYSEMLETYQKIVDNKETPADQKAIAVQEISNITRLKNGIMIAENLIKNKGFNEVIILENSGMVNVVVKAVSLNQEQISKIQNIVERELSVQIENINISNKN